nr:NAD(P)-dependent oxidoreductase [Maliibacterium massiliense]
MSDQKRVLVTYRMPDCIFEKLASSCEVVMPPQGGLKQSEFLEMLPQFDGVIALFNRVDDAALDAAPRIRVVTAFGAGYDNIDVDACTRHGVLACHIPQAVCEPTAEYSMGMIIDVLRTITWSDRQLRTNPDYLWAPAHYPSRLVMGRTLGIVGMGRIGKAVARRARAFDMRIVYYNRHRLSPGEEARYEATYLPLDELLQSADVVSLHTPLTDETRGLIDARALSRMKSNACLVNMARGPVVDEPALIDALQHRRIAAAALDVFPSEPNINPIYKTLDNVIITPHIATDALEARIIMGEACAENLFCGFAGRRPPFPLNAEAVLG